MTLTKDYLKEHEIVICLQSTSDNALCIFKHTKNKDETLFRCLCKRCGKNPREVNLLIDSLYLKNFEVIINIEPDIIELIYA